MSTTRRLATGGPSLIDAIVEKLMAVPLQNGTLVLTPQDFNLDPITAFFNNVLQAQSLTIAGATRTQTTDPAGAVVKGQGTVLNYQNLDVTLTFAAEDTAGDDVAITIDGTFPASQSFTPPLLTWIAFTELGLTAVYDTTTGVVQFAVHGKIRSGQGAQAVLIPFTLGQSPPSSWQISVAGQGSTPVNGEQLVELMSGTALTQFFPQPLIDVLESMAVTGVNAVFDPTAGTITYFATGVTVTNGWELAPKVRLLPGLTLSLTLVDPTSPGKLITGKVTGTFSLNGTTVPLFVQGAAGASTMWICGVQPDQTVVLPSFSDLFSLAGDVSLPPGLSSIPQIEIDALTITFDPVRKTLNEIQFTIQTVSTWPVIPTYFEVTNIYVSLDLTNIIGGGAVQTQGLLRFTFTIAGVFLQCQIAKQASETGWTMTAGLPPGHTVDLVEVAAKLFEGKITLPADRPPSMSFSVLQISINTASGLFTFSAHSADTWNFLGVSGFAIKTFELDFTRDPSKPGTPITGTLATTLEIGSVDLTLKASLNATPAGGWQFDGATGAGQLIPIGELIAYIASIFKVTDLPGFITGITLQDLSVSFNTTTRDFKFGVTGNIPVAEKTLSIRVDIAILSKQGGTFTKSLSGTITLGDAVFTLDFTASTTGTTFKANWTETGGQTLGFADITHVLGLPAPDIPPELDLGLDAASFVYDSTASTFILSASSIHYGKATLAAWKDTGGWEVFFGVDTGATINLANLPLIDKVLPAGDTVALEDISAEASSAVVSQAEATRINNDIGTSFPRIPDAGIGDGFQLSMIFNAGGQKQPIAVGTMSSGQNVVSLVTQEGPASATGTTKWFNLQKTLGPVTFEKVGVRYENSILWGLMNATLNAGGLTLSVLGLGVGSPLTDFEPKFTIDGIGVTFQQGGIEISGGLVGTLSPLNFYGELIIGASNITISALGAYGQVEGQSSLFLYAVLDYPIGGPPYFFVTGLAAGFGYNRRLLIPPLSGIPTFPLVQWAMGTGNPPVSDPSGNIGAQVTKVLTTLSESGVVAPSVGDDWIAAGIRFTSFELVDSFALLTVIFGNQFEVALLGLSRLSVPPQVTPPVALVELELVATFVPAQGLLAISAQLSPQSYVLSKDCHLTGGFAFYVWFSGQFAGDFVITLGGYSPMFTPPAHYPSVPRLGMNWQVTSELTISGSLYFALTSTAIMAGGSMSAVWSSGPIRAWFSVRADFLMVFTPFHYYIGASIQLGASFKVDLWFTTVTMTIHLGVGIEIWGPEFTGVATVDLSIISFTIRFGGSGQNTATTVSWGTFVDQLLPGGSNSGNRLAATAGAPAPGPAIVQINVSGGLISTYDNNGTPLYLVNAEKLVLTTQAAVPSKTSSFSSNITLAPADQQPRETPNTNFGVGPTGTDSAGFQSNHEITITSTATGAFEAVRTLSNVPKALWQKKNFNRKGVPVGVDPLNDTTITNVLTGFSLVPVAPVPDHTLPIELQFLQFTIDPNIQHFSWSNPYFTQSDPFSDQTVAATINSGDTLNNRPKLLAAVNRNGLHVSTNVNVAVLADPVTNYLLAPPMLRILGEQR